MEMVGYVHPNEKAVCSVSIFPFNSHAKELIINRMFIGPCIIVIVEELKTNLMSIVVFISLIFAQHVSNINMSIFRSLRL